MADAPPPPPPRRRKQASPLAPPPPPPNAKKMDRAAMLAAMRCCGQMLGLCGNALRADPALVGQHRRTDYWPRTPLGKACALGNLASVRAILSTPSGALTINLAPAPPPARPALLEAVWAIHLECVDAMLGHADIDTLCAEADGACALHEAAYWGKGRASVVPAEHQAASALLVTMLRHHAARGASDSRTRPSGPLPGKRNEAAA